VSWQALATSSGDRNPFSSRADSSIKDVWASPSLPSGECDENSFVSVEYGTGIRILHSALTRSL